jgi:hypothetical protein
MQNKILVLSSDHTYQELEMRIQKVVWNTHTRTYVEYVGNEWLEPGEVVVERLTAQ